MKRILVGIDGSPESKHAAEVAATLAEALKARLTLVYVVTKPVPVGPDIYPITLLERDVAECEYGRGLLREMAARCARPDLSVETRLETGSPAETLANLARETGADIVTVGHRGRNSVQRFLLGSVADRLGPDCHHARSDLESMNGGSGLREGRSTYVRAPEEVGMKCILVGVDGSPESRKAAQYGAQLARATQSGLELAYVLPEIVYSSPNPYLSPQRWQEERTDRAQVLLHEMSQSVPNPPAAVDTALLEGSPAHRLAAEASMRI